MTHHQKRRTLSLVLELQQLAEAQHHHCCQLPLRYETVLSSKHTLNWRTFSTLSL